MPPPETIRAHLPPPNPAEPADLRSDIIDEISDHLSCALDRERRHVEEPAARAAVIRRFGDPARLARRLWLDAMKEAIMHQRTALVTNIVLAVVCVAVCVFAFTAIRQNAELNAALLERLQTIGSAPAAAPAAAAATPTMEWTEAIVRVAKADGSPAGDYGVELQGRPFDGASERVITIDDTTNAYGEVHFGPVRPGSYWLKTVDAEDRLHRRQLILYPTRENEFNQFEVTWPAFSEATAPVTIDVDADEGLASFVKYYEVTLAPQPQADGEPIDGWTLPGLTLLVRPDARLAVLDETHQDVIQTNSRGGYANTLITYVDAARLAFTDSLAVRPDLLYEVRSVAAYVETEDGEELVAYRVQADRGVRRGMGGFEAPPPFSAAGGTTWHIRVPRGVESRVRQHVRETDRDS